MQRFGILIKKMVVGTSSLDDDLYTAQNERAKNPSDTFPRNDEQGCDKIPNGSGKK